MSSVRVWLIVLPVFVAVLVAGLVGAEKDNKKSGPPPLKVDKGAPLLLDEAPKPGAGGKPSGPVADNQACHVCHTNYQEEPMAVSHAKANVGCVKCHGESLPHRNDEDNITPPDIIFPAGKIDAACKKCHENHDVAAAKVVARWQERCARRLDPSRVVCTDCHGEHRLKLRTVRWDKETRKLISRKVEASGKK
jgi:formate-dependent nitrite reductase cytochrome c552 subunit